MLSHYGLLVDCRNKRLLDGITSLSTRVLIAPPSVPSVKIIALGTPTKSLLEEFPGLSMPAGCHRDIRHNTTHHIRTTHDPPVACRPRRLSPDVLPSARVPQAQVHYAFKLELSSTADHSRVARRNYPNTSLRNYYAATAGH